jgi:hypothetical protein
MVDEDGKPVVTPQDTMVYLTSSNAEIATVQSFVEIPAGTAYVQAKVGTTSKVGESTITATAAGLAAANLQFKTLGSQGTISQYALGLNLVPKVAADGNEQEAVFIQLQDQTGNPVPAPGDIAVTLSSSSLVAGKIDPSVTILSGSTFAFAKFVAGTEEDDKVKITASSQGFKSVEATMDVTVQPMTVTLVERPPTKGNFGDEVTMEVQAKSGTLFLEGATVEVGGPTAESNFATTDEEGMATGTYTSTLPGKNTIEVKVTKPGFKETIIKSSITLEQDVNLIVTATSQAGRELTAQLKIQAPKGSAKNYNTKPGDSAELKNVNWGKYVITAPAEFTNSDGKFTFAHWSDGSTENPRSFEVVQDTTISAVYTALFHAEISSDYGLTQGSGNYREGEKITIGIDTTSVSTGLMDKTFAGWSGDIRSETQNAQVTMDGPKVIKAEWRDNYLKVALLAGGLGAAGVIVYLKVLKPRKQRAEKERAPDLDWYKS